MPTIQKIQQRASLISRQRFYVSEMPIHKYIRDRHLIGFFFEITHLIQRIIQLTHLRDDAADHLG